MPGLLQEEVTRHAVLLKIGQADVLCRTPGKTLVRPDCFGGGRRPGGVRHRRIGGYR
jgi:hypothetical protein